MTVIGFHCSHEQISPAQLLRDVQHAERVTGREWPRRGVRYRRLIDAFGEHVLPQLSPTAPASTPVMA